MVQKPLNNPSTEDLLRASETARRRLAYDIAAFKHRANVPARVKESLQTHPTGWIGGSLVAGLIASMALRRRNKPAVRAEEKKVARAGLAGLALTAGGALLKPMLKSFVTGYLRRTLASHLGDHGRHDR